MAGPVRYQIQGLLLALLATASLPATLAADDATDDIAMGEAFVATHCRECHTIAADDDSPHPEAPSLRRLASKYPLEHLAEALVEGIAVGHPDMPEFELTADQVVAVLGYLATIQEPVSDTGTTTVP